MGAVFVREVFHDLRAAGLVMELTPENGIAISPAKLLTSDLRDMIRRHRGELIKFLEVEAANDLQAPEPATTPAPAWRQADAKYLRHHFSCKTCCAAGHGRSDRCQAGANLWATYEAACEAGQRQQYRRDDHAADPGDLGDGRLLDF